MYFLQDVSPQFDISPPPAVVYTLTSLSYIGVSVSTVCIFITVLTYLSSKKLRHAKNTPLLINFCFSLLGIYTTFMISSRVTKYVIICSIAGAGVHYFMLVTFFLMAAEALDLYVYLVIVIGIPSFFKNRYALKAALLSWSE